MDINQLLSAYQQPRRAPASRPAPRDPRAPWIPRPVNPGMTQNEMITALYGPGHGQSYRADDPNIPASTKAQLMLMAKGKEGLSQSGTDQITDYSAYGMQYRPRATTHFSNAHKGIDADISMSSPAQDRAQFGVYQTGGEAAQAAQMFAPQGSSPSTPVEPGYIPPGSFPNAASDAASAAAFANQQSDKAGQIAQLRNLGLDPSKLINLSDTQIALTVQDATKRAEANRPYHPAMVNGEYVSPQLREMGSDPSMHNPQLQNLSSTIKNQTGRDINDGFKTISNNEEARITNAGQYFRNQDLHGKMRNVQGPNGMMIPQMLIEKKVSDPNSLNGSTTTEEWVELSQQQKVDLNEAMRRGIVPDIDSSRPSSSIPKAGVVGSVPASQRQPMSLSNSTPAQKQILRQIQALQEGKRPEGAESWNEFLKPKRRSNMVDAANVGRTFYNLLSRKIDPFALLLRPPPEYTEEQMFR